MLFLSSLRFLSGSKILNAIGRCIDFYVIELGSCNGLFDKLAIVLFAWIYSIFSMTL